MTAAAVRHHHCLIGYLVVVPESRAAYPRKNCLIELHLKYKGSTSLVYPLLQERLQHVMALVQNVDSVKGCY